MARILITLLSLLWLAVTAQAQDPRVLAAAAPLHESETEGCTVTVITRQGKPFRGATIVWIPDMTPKTQREFVVWAKKTYGDDTEAAQIAYAKDHFHRYTTGDQGKVRVPSTGNVVCIEQGGEPLPITGASLSLTVWIVQVYVTTPDGKPVEGIPVHTSSGAGTVQGDGPAYLYPSSWNGAVTGKNGVAKLAIPPRFLKGKKTLQIHAVMLAKKLPLFSISLLENTQIKEPVLLQIPHYGHVEVRDARIEANPKRPQDEATIHIGDPIDFAGAGCQFLFSDRAEQGTASFRFVELGLSVTASIFCDKDYPNEFEAHASGQGPTVQDQVIVLTGKLDAKK